MNPKARATRGSVIALILLTTASFFRLAGRCLRGDRFLVIRERFRR
jgi:hypothetical protein